MHHLGTYSIFAPRHTDSMSASLNSPCASKDRRAHCRYLVNRPQNEFIWDKDKAELEAKGKEFRTAVAATGVKLGGNVAKMELRKVESAFA